jgi:PBP1b-binding outer membrane lipoprotein LpoB
MRYITIILCAMLLGSCGRLNSLKLAGEKVKQTVEVCSQSVSCPDVECPSVSKKQDVKEGVDTRASASWDTHMMLW